MLSLFRKNDPFLNVLLIILLVIVRLLYTFLGDLNLQTTSGTQSYLLNEVFSLSLNAYGHIWFSAVLVMINMLLINQLIRSNQAFDENNYLGGLTYLLLSNSAIPFFQLSGSLVASTCLLLALSLILHHVKQRASEENIFFTGVLIGLSVLFYSPLAIFLPLTLLVYVFYTRTIPRRYVLATFGFCFPFIVTYSISLYGAKTFPLSFFFENLFSRSIAEDNLLSFFFVLVPLLLMMSKLLGSFNGLKMTNHQIHFHRIMFLLFLSAIYLFFAAGQTFGLVWVLSIPATYFICKSLLEMQRPWVRNTVFFLLLCELSYPYLSAAYF